MKNKLFALAVATTCAISMMAGCGADSTSTTSSTDVKSASESMPAGNSTSESMASSASTSSNGIKIGYSLKTVQEERWQRELDGCIAAAKDLGVDFVYQVANNDAQTQISQIENLLTQNIDVLMVTAVDQGALTNTLEEAHQDGVKILIYDQQLSNTYGDAFVGYSDYDNGTKIAQVVKEKNVSGNVVLLNGDKSSNIDQIIQGEKDELKGLDINIVMEQYCQNWAAENALGYAQNALAQYNNDISAFVCMNDGIASGAIQALEDAGLDGKVVVTGMDCEETAAQRIVAGTQTSTLFKDSAQLSRAAVETAVKMAQGETVSGDATVNFGVNDMPQVVVSSVVITKDNIDSALIDTGYMTKEQIYGN